MYVFILDNMSIACDYCGMEFTRRDSMIRHIKRRHSNMPIPEKLNPSTSANHGMLFNKNISTSQQHNEREISQPSTYINDNCQHFPLYCNAGKPHNLKRCEAVMKTYFSVGNVFICPSCNLEIPMWKDFMEHHSKHAGQFYDQQKKCFRKSSTCTTFPLYCTSDQPHNIEKCTNIMKRYYRIGSSSYGCPSCNIALTCWTHFMSSHRQHAGQFASGQKQVSCLRSINKALCICVFAISF